MKNSEVIAVIEPGVRTVVRMAPQRKGETYAQALQRRQKQAERIAQKVAQRKAA